MLKKTLIVGIGTLFAMNLCADFPADFSAATDIYGKQKYQEAQGAFVKLADSAPTPKSKAECLAYAATSLARLKKYDDAIAFAKKIEVKPISINCQMDIMRENEKYKELVDAFKDEDISAWPDYIMQKGFFNRGTAYSKFPDMYPAAAKDLEKAVENAGSDEIFLMTGLHSLGVVYQAMKDDQKALDTYRKVTSRGRDQFYLHYACLLPCAKILVQQAKYDEAVAELKKADISKTAGNWKYLFLEAYGDIDIAQGRKEEGIAKYKEAMATKDVAGIYIDMMNKKLDSLNDK